MQTEKVHYAYNKHSTTFGTSSSVQVAKMHAEHAGHELNEMHHQ